MLDIERHPVAQKMADRGLDRQKEDDLAEAHFTIARRKEIELNEGGLVETMAKKQDHA